VTTEHFLQIMDNMTTVQYGNIMLRVYLSLDKFCPHRMEQHVLMYLYEGEVLLTERGRTTVLSKGECAFIRKDCNVMMDKRCVGGKPFVATFLSFTREFLLDFYKQYLTGTTCQHRPDERAAVCANCQRTAPTSKAFSTHCCRTMMRR
jgi:hypothetical protein